MGADAALDVEETAAAFPKIVLGAGCLQVGFFSQVEKVNVAGSGQASGGFVILDAVSRKTKQSIDNFGLTRKLVEVTGLFLGFSADHDGPGGNRFPRRGGSGRLARLYLSKQQGKRQK